MKGKHDAWRTEEGLLKIQGWAKDGLIESQIAKNMGIAYASLRRWKEIFPEIGEALRKGKEVVDRQVENALLKRALGYTYEEVEITDSAKHGHTEKRTTKTVLPDVTAQIFWLKNRKPAEWRDKVDMAATVAAGSEDTGFLKALNAKAGEVWNEKKAKDRAV